MGRFKTEAVRTLRRMAKLEGEVPEDVPVPNGWRKNGKNRRLFKSIREAKLHAALKASGLK